MRRNRRNTKVSAGARLGQHFLKAPWAARALALAVPLKEGETILEIGPGKGALTRELLQTGKKVVAVEKDEALVENLREKFAGEIRSGALKIVEGDVRDIIIEQAPGKTVRSARRGEGGARDVSGHTASATLRLRNEAGGTVLPGGYVVAANIPYYITGEIIRQFLTAEAQPRAMALLVQKEVAKRIVSERESILSLSVKAYGIPRIVKNVPRGNFSPPPNVDSAILSITDISRGFFADVDEEGFFKVVRAGFASKRKFLANNLSVFGKEKAVAAISACGIQEKARAEDVSLPKWKSLAKQFLDSKN